MLRLRCHHCHAVVPMTAALFVGSIILCAHCHGQLARCPKTECDGRLLEVKVGPYAGDWECSECEEAYQGRLLNPRAFWPATSTGEKVIQFPSPIPADE